MPNVEAISTQVKGLHSVKPQITPHLNASGFGCGVISLDVDAWTRCGL